MIDIEKAFEGRWRIKGFDDYEVRQLSGESVKELCRDFFEAGVLLSQEPQTKEKISNEMLLNIRYANFCNKLTVPANIDKYGKQMIYDFIDYWTEPNKSKTKMRFELQQTFDVNRRLARWARNNFNRYDRQQSTTEEQRTKLGDILAP